MSPDSPRGSEFGDFLQKIIVNVKEKTQARGKVVNVQARLQRRFNVSNTVSDGESNFLNGRGSGFANVITADADCIPLRNIVFAKRKDIGDEAHAVPRGINISASGNVFFEDIVLNGATQISDFLFLFLSDANIERQKNSGCGIDSHTGRDFIQRNVFEEKLHVFEA